MPGRPRLRPWMLVSAAWIVPAFFAAFNQLAQARLNGRGPVSLSALLFSGGDWLLYAFLTPGVFAISRRWPLVRGRLVQGAFRHGLLSLAFCVAWATSGKLLQLVLGLTFSPDAVHAALNDAAFWQKAGVDWLSWVFTTLPFGVAVYLCMVGTEHAIRYFVEARDRAVQVARLSEQLAGARFAALQAQVNPHFLFNTLNTIAVLVRDDDRQGAVRIVEQLSDVLRRTLSRHRANEVMLGEELDLVRQYAAIEQARFSDRLRPEFLIDAGVLGAAVPSFAIQHLLENAIRHGIARRPDAGRVTVTARRAGDMLEVSVADDGIGIDPDVPAPAAHGIENTRERLRALYGNRATLALARRDPHGTVATLRLPYRQLTPEAADGAR